jgi:hypothetical protein
MYSVVVIAMSNWLFERNQGIGRYIPDAIKNQPWNINPMSSSLNNWAWAEPREGPAGRAELGGRGRRRSDDGWRRRSIGRQRLWLQVKAHRS